MTDTNTIHTQVRETYGAIARSGGSCCGPNGSCGPNPSARLGYSDEELAAAPEGADMGLGCGNPQAIAALKPGERVLDLGSGAGFDAFLAARQVGPEGKVIGVDMTPDMVTKARRHAAESDFDQVDFRLGELEHLPVADDSIDVILSNCVLNLVPDKQAAYREAFRVLAEGGRLAISDVVATAPIPEELLESFVAYTGCVSGAAHVDEIRAMLEEVGFSNVTIDIKEASRQMFRDWFPGTDADQVVASATIEATKRTKDADCCAPTCCG